MVKIAQSIRSFLVGRNSIADFGDRYPVVDRTNMSSVAGLYVIGNIAGTPDIRSALNSGSDIGRHLERELATADDAPDADHGVVIVGAGPAGIARVGGGLRLSRQGDSPKPRRQREAIYTSGDSDRRATFGYLLGSYALCCPDGRLRHQGKPEDGRRGKVTVYPGELDGPPCRPHRISGDEQSTPRAGRARLATAGDFDLGGVAVHSGRRANVKIRTPHPLVVDAVLSEPVSGEIPR